MKMRFLIMIFALLWGSSCAQNGKKEKTDGLAQFQDVRECVEGKYFVKENGLFGVVDAEGNFLLPPKYQYMVTSYPYETLILFKEEGKYGLMDLDLQIVQESQFDVVDSFDEEHFAAVWKDGKMGYINEQGEIIVPPAYDRLTGRRGFFVVSDSGKAGVLTAGGDTLVPLTHKEMDLAGLLPCFCGRIDSLKGCYDYRGKITVPFQYEDIRQTGAGILSAKLGGKWGFITQQGKKLTAFEYDKVSNGFAGDKAEVRKGNKIGFVNNEAQVIIPVRYLEVLNHFKPSFWARTEAGWGKITQTGETLIPHQYTFIKPLNFANEYGAMRNGKAGLIDEEGEIVIPFKYDSLMGYEKDKYLVQKRGKWGIIDREEKVLIPMQYDYIGKQVQNHDLLPVRNKGRYGMINWEGAVVIELKYDEIKSYQQYGRIAHYLPVRIKDKWGYVSLDGKSELPLIYDKVDFFFSGVAGVTLNGVPGFIQVLEEGPKFTPDKK